MHYVIGDVHGCFDEMLALIHKIEEQDADAKFIFVGDMIDRGPKVWDMLNWAMDNITKDGKYQCVMGNHEYMILMWYETFLDWYRDDSESGEVLGMPATFYDFAERLIENECTTPEKIWPIITFFQGLPYSKSLEIETVWGKKVTYRIVHACYDYQEPENSMKQRDCNITKRNYLGCPTADEIVVHGHTPTIVHEFILKGFRSDRPGMICYRPNAINIDGGCCFLDKQTEYPCMLCAICLENLEEIYHCDLEERFEQFEGSSYKAYKKNYLKRKSVPQKQILRRMGKFDETKKRS